MSDQATLPLFRTGHETQEAAARKVAPRAPSLREKIYEFIAAQGEEGAMIDEIQQKTGFHLGTCCGRISELKGGMRRRKWHARWIEDSGRKRDTASGSPAIVWISTTFRRRLSNARSS